MTSPIGAAMRRTARPARNATSSTPMASNGNGTIGGPYRRPGS